MALVNFEANNGVAKLKIRNTRITEVISDTLSLTTNEARLMASIESIQSDIANKSAMLIRNDILTRTNDSLRKPSDKFR